MPCARTEKTKKKLIRFVWHRTPSSTANTEIENQREPSELLSDIKHPRHCLTEKSVDPQSCRTPEQTLLYTNSHWMTWSTHITAVCQPKSHMEDTFLPMYPVRIMFVKTVLSLLHTGSQLIWLVAVHKVLKRFCIPWTFFTFCYIITARFDLLWGNFMWYPFKTSARRWQRYGIGLFLIQRRQEHSCSQVKVKCFFFSCAAALCCGGAHNCE